MTWTDGGSPTTYFDLKLDLKVTRAWLRDEVQTHCQILGKACKTQPHRGTSTCSIRMCVQSRTFPTEICQDQPAERDYSHSTICRRHNLNCREQIQAKCQRTLECASLLFSRSARYPGSFGSHDDPGCSQNHSTRRDNPIAVRSRNLLAMQLPSSTRVARVTNMPAKPYNCSMFLYAT